MTSAPDHIEKRISENYSGQTSGVTLNTTPEHDYLSIVFYFERAPKRIATIIADCCKATCKTFGLARAQLNCFSGLSNTTSQGCEVELDDADIERRIDCEISQRITLAACGKSPS